MKMVSRSVFIWLKVVSSLLPLLIVPVSAYSQTISIGVRSDAKPFSFRSDASEHNIIDGYEGYSIHVCREVVQDLVSLEKYSQYGLRTVEVNASERFRQLNIDDGIDILCGADSITVDRMKDHFVSFPMYITGAGIASSPISSANFPQGEWCKTMVGYLKNTTVEEFGLSELAKSGKFGRFSEAVEFYSKLIGDTASSQIGASANPTFKNVCPSGTISEPIKGFDDHLSGMRELCEGRIVFYVADVDIISEYARSFGRDCELEIDRQVLYVERYGIYFRDDGDLESQELYLDFNRILWKKVFGAEQLLERAYQEAFGNRARTGELGRFFDFFR